MRPGCGCAAAVGRPGTGPSCAYLRRSLLAPDKTSEGREQCGHPNTESSVPLFYLVLHRCRGATRVGLRDKRRRKEEGRRRRRRIYFLPLNCWMINSTCSRCRPASSEATRVSQFRSFSFSATDNIRRFLEAAAASAAPSSSDTVFTLSTGERESESLGQYQGVNH